MKKLLSFALLAMILLACNPTKNENAPQQQSSANVMPDVHDVAMYQVNPRVFAPKNSLNAVAARIDSIKALGVNVMWVMPIYPIGEEKSKNSPYSIKDYKAVAPEFGTIDDFKNLVKVCHEKGMAIILDWVANHTAWDNVWMRDHKDWYTQDEKGNVIYPPGTDWTDVADLNYDNPDMRAAMLDAMKFWIVDVGIDGFRCDVADMVPVDFWKNTISELRKAAGQRRILMLAEGTRKANLNEAGFDMDYGWDYRASLLKVFAKGESVKLLFATDSLEYDSLPATKVKLRFITNHDEATKQSPMVEYGGERASMAAFVASVMPHGGALIYSSQEAGFEKTINFFNYVPVDWSAHPDIYAEYKDLIHLYNSLPALRRGELKPLDTGDDVMAFEKTLSGDRFLIIVNARNKNIELDVPAEWQRQVKDVAKNSASVTLGKKLSLKPYQYCIYRY